MKALVFLLLATPAWGGYTYYRSLTVTSNAALLPSTLTNFPVPFFISHASMKTVGNGGHIQNTTTQATGPAVTMPADFVIATNIVGTSKIAWEIESYDATNGIVWGYLLCATCAAGTVFYAVYGDSAVTTAQNTGSLVPANVWDSNFKRVYHLGDGTTLFTTDSTANAANGTAVNTPTAAVGQVDGGGAFASASSQRITFADTSLPVLATNRTQECWVNMASSPTANPIVLTYGTASAGLMSALVLTGTSPNAHLRYATFGTTITGAINLAISTWYHTAIIYNGTNAILYVNGVQDVSTAIGPSTALSTGRIASRNDDTLHFDGKVDECRISSSVRAPDWITATYASGNAPATFLAVGTESLNGGPRRRVIF